MVSLDYIESKNTQRESEEQLIKALETFPFSYERHLKLLQIYRQKGEVKKFFYHFARAFKYCESEILQKELWHVLDDYTKDLVKRKDKYYRKHVNELSRELNEFQKVYDPLMYPLEGVGNTPGESLLRKKFLEGRAEEDYFLNLYRAAVTSTIGKFSYAIHKYELLKGEYVSGQTVIEKGEHDIIAVSGIDGDITLKVLMKDRFVEKKNLSVNQFNYYNIPAKGQVKLSSSGKFFVSHFKCRPVENKPKLVLYMFIDGLSYEFLKESGLSEAMPRVSRFFEQGFTTENCYASSEWTMPSVMSMSTGKYTTGHLFYDGSWDMDYAPEKHSRLIQEYFYDEGYMTASICNNWRRIPPYGYYKKTNRTVYSPMFERMYGEEMVAEAIEHLESFKHFSNYLWLTLEDLHSVAHNIDNSLLASFYEDKLLDNNVDEKNLLSHFKEYDPDKISHYLAEIKRLDFIIGFLLDYIEANYKEDEYIVVLNSDHGQGLLSAEKEMFHSKRTKVPFMIRGKSVPAMKSEEIISNIDILPTVLKLCELKPEEDIDGRLMFDFGGEKREYAFTESLVKGRPYYAAVNDADYVFWLTTSEMTFLGGAVDLRGSICRLVRKSDGKDETETRPDKLEMYYTIVYEHIKSRIQVGS